MVDRVYNFYPGPATLPLPALKRAKEELLNWEETGMSILEISHRSKEYDKLHNEAIALVRDLMGVPDDYEILWLQGGASTQFFMIPQNLHLPGRPMEYADTGRWSEKAIEEAELYGDVKVVASSAQDDYKYVPRDVKFSSEAAFAHITSNNTVNGTQWHYWPEVPKDVPLTCDMSSDILSREIDVKDFGVIYAGIQKNIGPAGATLIIIREDLLDRVPENVPTLLKWKTEAAKNSLYHTPPVFAIYIAKLVMDHYKELGGVPELERRAEERAKYIYDVIDGSDGFYTGHARKDSRSLMNVTFNLPTEELEKKCVEEATLRGFIGLKGHRSVGGMRISIYNAADVEGTKELTEFMKEFQDKNQ